MTAAEMAAVGIYKIALGVEYRGARYRGFQRQRDGVPSIQAALEKALSKVAGGAPVTLSCAGRTDALVHASGQVVHFDTTVERSMHAWVMGANMNLPGDISVTWAKAMPKHFDARFCAMARRYRYVIYNDQIRPAHMAEEVTWNHRPLDIERMREAAKVFLAPMTSAPSAPGSARPSRRSRRSIISSCCSTAVLSSWTSAPTRFCIIWCAISPVC